jgi:hypothetical protein
VNVTLSVFVISNVMSRFESTLTPPSSWVNTFPSIVIVAAAPLGLVLGEAETLAEGEGLDDGDVLVEADGDVLGDSEGVALTDAEGEAETDADGDSDGVPLGLLEADTDGELLGDGELDGLLEADAEGDVLELVEGLVLGLVEAEALGDDEADADGDDEGLEPPDAYPKLHRTADVTSASAVVKLGASPASVALTILV